MHLEGQGSAQVFISDYTLNSLVNAAIDLDWFNFVRTFHADDIDQHINNFAIAYGARTEVELSCQMAKGSQKLSITGGRMGSTQLSGLVEMHIRNPFVDESEGREMDAVFL